MIYKGQTTEITHLQQLELALLATLAYCQVKCRNSPGPCFNIKMPAYQYWQAHVKEKTSYQPSFLQRRSCPYQQDSNIRWYIFILKRGPGTSGLNIKAQMQICII